MEISNLLNAFRVVGVGILIVIIMILMMQNNTLVRARDKVISENISLTNLITTQNQAIADWQRAAKMEEQRLEDAQVDAAKATEISKGHAKKIMDSNVPTECSGAILWGITQAQNLKASQ